VSEPKTMCMMKRAGKSLNLLMDLIIETDSAKKENHNVNHLGTVRGGQGLITRGGDLVPKI
jgi:hypothetical protein